MTDITPDQLTPGTRFYSNEDYDNCVMVVVNKIPATFFQEDKWIWSVLEPNFNSVDQKETHIFHIDEIGEIL
jgi:hypothetical protein